MEPALLTEQKEKTGKEWRRKSFSFLMHFDAIDFKIRPFIIWICIFSFFLTGVYPETR